MANAVETLSHFARKIKTQQKFAQERLVKFQEEILENPAEAFRWADSAFSAAATLKICKEVDHYLQEAVTPGAKADEILANVRRTAFEQVSRGARHPASSTSQSANHMERERVRAWAEVLDQMDLSSI